jgi:uncharacterized protein (TIGR03083 family)
MLTRQRIQSGYPGELEDFSSLLGRIDDGSWAKPTRCEGWAVSDVASHVIGILADVFGGRLEGIGTPEWSERQLAERRGKGPAELRAELDQLRELVVPTLQSFDDEFWKAPAPPGVAGSNGFGIEGLWYDTYVHGDDIRAAIGAKSVRGAGLTCSVSQLAGLLTNRGYPPTTLALDGMESFPVSGGGGREVTGDPLAFVLVATGRADPSQLGLAPDINVYRDA